MKDFSPDRLAAEARRGGLRLDPGQAERLSRFVGILLVWAAKTNLIGPQAKERLWEDHLAEALWLEDYLSAGEPIADLGSGAGLPGLVLACLAPARRIHLFESRSKKSSFLTLASAELGLANVRVFECRVPASAPPEARGAYAQVVSRAAGPTKELLAPAGWLLREGGRLLMLKGPRGKEELAEASELMTRQGWRLEDVVAARLYGREKRLVRLIKTGP